MRTRRAGLARTAALALAFTAAGCTGIGPQTVKNDRLDYVNAVSESWKEQMLLNMVKLRYGDAPIFLDVTSIIAQYSVETQLDARFGWAQQNRAENSQSVGGSAKYTDRPTVTYNPLAGEKFTRSLLTPIRPSAIMSLIQAGYPVDLVLRFCVSSINGVRNDYGGAARSRTADPEFYPLLGALRRIQTAGALGFRVLKATDGRDIIVNFPLKVPPETTTDIEEALRILNLEPKVRDYTVSYGLVPEGKREIALLTRSVFEILVDISSYIDVPEEHVAEKRVNKTFAGSAPERSILAHPIRILSTKNKPDDVLVAVPYRDHWFSIDDKDPLSKRLFSFLMFILALTETGDRGAAPLVTIPTG